MEPTKRSRNNMLDLIGRQQMTFVGHRASFDVKSIAYETPT